VGSDDDDTDNYRCERRERGLSTRKRANGEGTVYFQAARRRWCAVVWLADGRRKYYYAPTRQVAARRLAEALKRQEAGLPLPIVKQSLAAFLQRWLAESVEPNVRPWTYKGYEVVVRVHLIPAIGRSDLQELTPQQVQAFLNRKIADGLSPKTVQSIRGVLRTALNEAMRWELVSRNVATLVRPPRAFSKPVSPFTPDEARRLLEASRSDRLGSLYAVALAMGLRQGEALGLTWDRVDFDSGLIRVDRQLQRAHGKLQLVDLKTRHSRRSVPMPPSIADWLKRHLAAQAVERNLAGARWQGRGLVFTTPIGTGLDGPNVTKGFQRLLRSAGLERRRFHDLRHSCATLLLVQNVPPRVVMEILGHSQITLTMNTYSHVLPELTQDAAASMERVLRPVRP
jgi:integrase